MSPSGPSAGKVAGFLLLGVAAVALVIGLVTAVSGNGESRADDGGGSASASAPGSPPGTPGPSTSDGGTPGPTSPGGGNGGAPGTGGPGEPGGPGGPGGPEGPGGGNTVVVPPPPKGGGSGGGDNGGIDGGGNKAQPVVDRSSPVRVYNNSTIKGLAQRAAADFRDAGYDVVSVSNYSEGLIPVSTVYWGKASEKGTASSLAGEFELRTEKRFKGIQDASPGVIVIVTNNYSS